MASAIEVFVGMLTCIFLVFGFLLLRTPKTCNADGVKQKHKKKIASTAVVFIVVGILTPAIYGIFNFSLESGKFYRQGLPSIQQRTTSPSLGGLPRPQIAK